MTDTFDPTAFPLPPQGSCSPVQPTDEEALIEVWRAYIGTMPEDELDLELVKLLELIHSSI